jgi:hypothetical protein
LGATPFNILIKDKKRCDSRKDKIDVLEHKMFDYDIDVFTKE